MNLYVTGKRNAQLPLRDTLFYPKFKETDGSGARKSENLTNWEKTTSRSL